jgi:hypothetical protein
VAEDGSVPTGEDSGHPPSALAQPCVPYGVDAVVHKVQSADAQAIVDRVGAQAEVHQLPMRDHAVLVAGERRDRALEEFWDL